MIEILIIVVFAALQSILGIGILFFGTPTLILLGYPFIETLAVVLPASMAVSFLQLVRGSLPEASWRRRFTLWCLIPLIAVLGSSILFKWQFQLELIIACILFLYVLIRISPRLHQYLRDGVRARASLWLGLIGTIHGLSNLGGGLLAIFAANNFNDKLTIRNHIAFCYLAFASVQLCILAIVAPHSLQWVQLTYAATSGVVFAVCERGIFHSISFPTFDRTFTVVIGCYSILIFLKIAGVFDNMSAA